MYICIYSLYKSPWSRNQHFIEIPMKSPFFFAKNMLKFQQPGIRTSAPEDSSCEVKAPERAWMKRWRWRSLMADLKDMMVNLFFLSMVNLWLIYLVGGRPTPLKNTLGYVYIYVYIYMIIYDYVYYWLVVDLPLWKIWVHQLGWWNSQYMET